MSIKSRINNLLKELPSNTLLLGVTKYANIDQMIEAYNAGINHFGESRTKDLLYKKEILKDYDIRWHFIGHLQKNKVKKVINVIDVLESLDSIELAIEINKYLNHKLDTFIEVKITDEENKTGIKLEDVDLFMNSIKEYSKINVIGFMGVGPIDLSKTDESFKKLIELKNKYPNMKLSFGMSNDYRKAIELHSDEVRIGSLIFGEENV